MIPYAKSVSRVVLILVAILLAKSTAQSEQPSAPEPIFSHHLSQSEHPANSGDSTDTAPKTPMIESRTEAERWMLMMQGMAGIGPRDSAWVASKLFEGMLPSEMSCCAKPELKDQNGRHQCCDLQQNVNDR